MLRAVTQTLAHFVLVFYTLSVIPMSAYAQAVDFDGPSVSWDQMPLDPASAEQAFSLLAKDKGGVKGVTLFHRLAGDPEYTATIMLTDASEEDLYTAIVRISVTSDSRLEYYVQAEDGVGNVTLKGFSFDPLLRIVSAPVADDVSPAKDQAVATSTAEPGATEPRKDRTLLYTVLGVLALGALAGLAGGGGGTAEPGGCSGDSCTLLTINFPVPQ
jgi:hypothetical protein